MINIERSRNTKEIKLMGMSLRVNLSEVRRATSVKLGHGLNKKRK